MSLHISVAHSGERLLADPASFGSLDTFKEWLSSATGIHVANQILLLPTGKQVKVQALLTERDIFLYNRQLISPSGSTAKPNVPLIPLPARYSPAPPPDTLSNQNDLTAWLELFRARRSWAVELASKCQLISDEVPIHFRASTTIDKALSVALGNLESHVRSLEQKHGEARAWSEQALGDQGSALASFDSVFAILKLVPAKMEFQRFLLESKTPAEVRAPLTGEGTLQSFVSEAEVRNLRSAVQAGRKILEDRIEDISKHVGAVVHDTRDLAVAIQRRNSKPFVDTSKASKELMEEIQIVVKKISSDYDHVLSLGAGPKAVSQASKMALLHTRNYLPTIKEYGLEMGEILEAAMERRNAASNHAMIQMGTIAAIEASFAKVNSQVLALDVPPEAAEALDRISLLARLPSVYGALLGEAVRRLEWNDRIRGESSILAEDIASYKDEEERRRKKWIKTFGSLINTDATKGDVLKFELNLQAEVQDWPVVTREDIANFLASISKLPILEGVANEIVQTVKDLDRPTKRQMKKAKAFKMGSIHEAAFGKGSFLLRDDDELRILRETNSKLEEDLKNHKSRVRKLENLVHNQNQPNRPSSREHYITLDGRPSTPTTALPSPKSRESFSRPMSVGDRRLSITKTTDERSLARRIVSLEADLNAEITKRLELEKALLASQGNETKTKSDAEEAHSIKRDLMENMEAQQREFAAERQSLEEEIGRYKMKLEEAEDELDRVLGSRDVEKVGTERRLQAAQQELDHTKKALKTFQDQAEEQRETHDIHFTTLRGIHSKFATTDCFPESETELVNALDALAERSVQHAQDLAQSLAMLKSEKENLQSHLADRDTEVLNLKSQIQSLEEKLTSTKDSAAEEEAKARSLSSELEDGRNQLRLLRNKFAEGETGSEALRQRVEEQAARASRLASELAASKSHTNSLDVELITTQRKITDLQSELAYATKRLGTRADKARELTSKLATQRRELLRLLENLGLSVSLREGAMFVQRTSKTANGSSVLTDPSGSRVALTPVTSGTTIDEQIDPNLLQWMQTKTLEAEVEKFDEFLEKLNTFDLVAFSEAIIKLRRDVEWTGMKWKKEARGYRDKYHRAQNEAHEKIAFRSFKEGDLALFLPTRNQATRPWAAFNVGAPHYFLREQDVHKLRNREWLVARISKVEERLVDLSKTIQAVNHSDRKSIGDASDVASIDDDNPFELSDGLRWYLLDAAEEKGGAPSTPGLGKTTIASTNVDVKGSIRMKKSSNGNDASTKLNKSLDSRRSSSHSMKAGSPQGPSGLKDEPLTSGQVNEVIAGDSRRSSTHLRPGSRSGQGLPIENPRSSSDEHPMSRASPVKSFLGLFSSASPSKSPLSTTPEGSSLKPRPRPIDNLNSLGGTASPSKADTSPARSVRSVGQVSPTKTAKLSTWDSIFSLDVSVEGDKSKK